jgi:hypothetical protein
MFSAMPTAIPAPIQTLLELFATSLADVRFADVDGQTLGRCAAEVEAAAEGVAAAQAALDAVRETLRQKQDALLQMAQCALAYARVYAESDEALTSKLDGVSLPRSTRRPRVGAEGLVLSPEPQPAPRPRGRPKKTPAAQPAVEELLLPAE